jgi:hypothetical protein
MLVPEIHPSLRDWKVLDADIGSAWAEPGRTVILKFWRINEPIEILNLR